MAKKLTPITLLCGYLGAGKTTLMNKVLTNQQGYKVAVIVNDIGEVNVDESLIAKGANITDTSSIVGLQNGCICCTLKSDLVKQIEKLIASKKFDYILIEASGVCEPMPIAQAIEQVRNGRLDNVVSVVDAARMVDEFAGGEKLLDKDNIDEEDIESLLVQQIEFCSTLIVNKKDLVTESQMKQVKAVVKALQPNVKVIEASRGDVPVEDILNTTRFDFDSVFESAAWIQALENGEIDHDEHDHHEEEHDHHHDHEEHHHDHDNPEHGEEGHHCDEHCHHHHHHHEHNHEGADEDEYGIGNFIYYRRRPFNREKLERFAGNWPRNIIRCKGMMWFSDEPAMAYMFETSGRQVQLGMMGRWFATASPKELQQAMAADPKLKEDWDEQVGDRMIKLCVIGQKLDKQQICEQLDALLD